MTCKQNHYPNQTIAEIAAETASEKYGEKMLPYHCQQCGDWHLSPAKRHTPQKNCDLCGKNAYETKSYAEKRAEIIEREQKQKLYIYECPFGNGWHLTSKKF